MAATIRFGAEGVVGAVVVFSCAARSGPAAGVGWLAHAERSTESTRIRGPIRFRIPVIDPVLIVCAAVRYARRTRETIAS